MYNLWAILYQTALGVSMTALFSESRFSKKRTYTTIGVLIALLLLIDTFLYHQLRMDRFMQIYPLLNHLPALMMAAYIGENRGWRLVFQLLSSVLFCVLIQHTGALAYLWSGCQIWVTLLVYGITTAVVIWFFTKYLRPLYLQVMHHLRRGWFPICLILATYYMILFYLFPGYVGESAIGTVIKPAISFLMTGVYTIIVILFSNTQRELEEEHSAALLAAQVSALRNRMEAVQAIEETVRIERHDLRHRLNTVATLVQAGNIETALTYIGSAQEQLDREQLQRWCANPLLDAVFSFYAEQARRNQIQLEMHLSFPEVLPVDAAGLSIVFANALENAIHACEKLPEEQRRILCRSISYPRLMLEVSNPSATPVQLNEEGFPIPSKGEGHGVGLRSIRSFCQKNHASIFCTYQDGWFSLRIAF